jgi:hypothetical protein
VDRRARIVRTRTGARLVQADATLSRVLERPGPTHGLFDVLAATVTAVAPGPRFLMLGFAAGGMVGPLRALGWQSPIDAVDRSPVGTGLFQRLCGSWAGEVELHRADAARFLGATRRRWHLILDDLSVLGQEGVEKPRESYAQIPRRVRKRLTPAGVSVVNLLPSESIGWRAAEREIRGDLAEARIITVESYENRLLLTGDALPSARDLARLLRGELTRIGSLLAVETSVRSVTGG